MFHDIMLQTLFISQKKVHLDLIYELERFHVCLSLTYQDLVLSAGAKAGAGEQ